MASVVKLGKQKQPPRAIDIVDDMDDKKRKRIRLGVVSHDFAEEACRRIEKLMAAKTLNQSLDHETQRWLVGISDVIHERIAKTGLCQPRQPKAVMTLSGWALKYISQRGTELKPRSIKSIEHTVDKLIACFGSDVSKIGRAHV